MTIRIMWDVMACGLLAYGIWVSRGKVVAEALRPIAAGFAVPLLVYLVGSSSGYRAAVSLDLAYSAMVVVVMVRTAGRPWLALPGKFLTPDHDQQEGKPRGLGFVAMGAFLLLYLLLEYALGDGI
ncbi:hypothetical protein NODU109028_02630 [Nocardioides dubius]|uniref:Uncharacterized protein n=1 Tax=Nocardioides dubius TaxID=317019 RepID=A0ABN1TQF0_9ACTN